MTGVLKHLISAGCFASLLFGGVVNAQWVRTSALDDGSYAYALATMDGPTGSSVFVGSYSFVSSTDDGLTWSSMNLGAAETDGLLVIDDSLCASAGYVYLSTDKGQTWALRDSADFVNRNASPLMFYHSDNTLYVSTQPISSFGDPGAGAFRSTDRGVSWVEADSGILAGIVRGWASIDNDIFMGVDNGIYRTTNQGGFWIPVDTGQSDFFYLSAITSIGKTLIASAKAGTFLSTDKGQSWRPSNLDTQLLHMTAFNQIGANLFAAGGSVYLSNDSGKSWSDVGVGLPKNVGFVALAATRTSLFAATSANGVWRRPLAEMIGTSGVEPTSIPQSDLRSYPNPTSSSTTIALATAERGFAGISIFNLFGIEVARLFAGELEAGAHTFMWGAASTPAGVYEVRLVTPQGSVLRRVVRE